jgi:hypothetical protein
MRFEVLMVVVLWVVTSRELASTNVSEEHIASIFLKMDRKMEAVWSSETLVSIYKSK